MSKLVCQNPECNKKFIGRESKYHTSKFCGSPCSSRHRQLFPELYPNINKFEKGHTPANKGVRTIQVGHTIIRRKKTKTGAIRDRRFAAIGYTSYGKPKYIRNDKYVWLLANGPIPKNHVLYHKDGRTLNDAIENLECIPFGEALSRYALQKKKQLNLQNKHHIEKIIIGCENGDKRIQKQLFEMLYSKMFVVALRYSSGHDAAKDVMSDAFVKVFENIKKVRVENGNLEGWVRRIVVNTAIDSIRKHSKTEHLTDSIDDEDCEYNYTVNKVSSDEDFSEDIDGKYIMEMIQDLSPGYRTVFNLVVMEGYSHKQVADELQISEGTSKSNLSKAKGILREKLLKFNEEEEESILSLENYCESEELSYV